MSEYTREKILKLIEENGEPKGLDLSGKDLSGIDLSREAIAVELIAIELDRAPDETPVWYNKWRGGINLKGANLQDANLQGANLQGANLRGTNLQEAELRDVNLQGAKLGNVNLQRAKLRNANLQEAKLQNVNLQGAKLRGANLQEAKPWGANLQRADLRGTNLQGAELRGANLQGADLRYSRLGKVDFFTVVSLEGAYFYGAFLDDTRMRREQLGGAIGEDKGRYDKAREVYLALKNNFAEIGRYGDESWAYIKERQMEKMMNHPRLARKYYYKKEMLNNPDTRSLWRFYIRHTTKWVAAWVVELACGYGESIPKTLRAMGVALVGFAILYRLLGAVVDANGNPSSGWLHCLLYSGGAFTTFGVDTLRPTNDWIRALGIFESVVGIALTGLLGFVLGNRIRRAQTRKNTEEHGTRRSMVTQSFAAFRASWRGFDGRITEGHGDTEVSVFPCPPFSMFLSRLKRRQLCMTTTC